MESSCNSAIGTIGGTYAICQYGAVKVVKGEKTDHPAVSDTCRLALKCVGSGSVQPALTTSVPYRQDPGV